MRLLRVFLPGLLLFSLTAYAAGKDSEKWAAFPSPFPAPSWKPAKGDQGCWQVRGIEVSCQLGQKSPTWLLSGVEISGDWTLQVTFDGPFRHRDEGLLLNVAPDLSRGYLVSLGPLGKLTLLRIQDGEVASVAVEFPIPSSTRPRTLQVTRVGANYEFWVDGLLAGDIANPLQERVNPPRWTEVAEPESGQYGLAFFAAGEHRARILAARPLHLEQKYVRNPVLRPLPGAD